MKIVADSLILSMVALRIFNGRILRRVSESVLFALVAFTLFGRSSAER
jgi:hypothetical protein